MARTAEQLGRALRGTIFKGKLHHLDSVGSTSTIAMKAAANGAAEGTVFMADEQTAGRGRGGHSWSSPKGDGLYLSAVLRPKLSGENILWLSLVAGLSVMNAIARVTGIVADLRWPNDVMLGDCKLAGVLTEISADALKISWAVIGVGINVNQQSFPAELTSSATSLRIESGRQWPRMELAGALLESLDGEYRALQLDPAQAAACIRQRVERHSSYVLATRVSVEDGHLPPFTGVAEGLDERGFLRVRTAGGVRTVLNGGVRKITG